MSCGIWKPGVGGFCGVELDSRKTADKAPNKFFGSFIFMLFMSGVSDNPNWVWVGVFWSYLLYKRVIELSRVSQISLWQSYPAASSQLNSQWLQLPVRPTLECSSKIPQRRDRNQCCTDSLWVSLLKHSLIAHKPAQKKRNKNLHRCEVWKN